MTGLARTAATQSLTHAVPFAQDVTPEERTLDDVLADSFPASDPPPWTLGVTSHASVTSRLRAQASRKVKMSSVTSSRATDRLQGLRPTSTHDPRLPLRGQRRNRRNAASPWVVAPVPNLRLLRWPVLDCATGAGERDAGVAALADHHRLDQRFVDIRLAHPLNEEARSRPACGVHALDDELGGGHRSKFGRVFHVLSDQLSARIVVANEVHDDRIPRAHVANAHRSRELDGFLPNVKASVDARIDGDVHRAANGRLRKRGGTRLQMKRRALRNVRVAIFCGASTEREAKCK